jgi:hypothetical protein
VNNRRTTSQTHPGQNEPATAAVNQRMGGEECRKAPQLCKPGYQILSPVWNFKIDRQSGLLPLLW